MRIEYLDVATSTNDVVRSYLSGGEDVIVCAERQTGGRGTKGRSFLSERGGVYLSALTFYENLPASRAFEVMAHAAVAVCRTAETFGVRPLIKWANDVYAAGRKLSGILVENIIEGGKVKASIVGIGLNAENDVSALGGIAVSLRELSDMPFTAETVRAELIRNLRLSSDFSEYTRRVGYLSETVTVSENGREYRAKLRRVLPDGRLEIEEGGRVRALSSAELAILPHK